MRSTHDKKQKQDSILPNVSDYYDPFELDDFSLSNGGSRSQGSGYKSKGGKGRNKQEVRKASGGKTCYSAKHVRIQTNKHNKTI
jgi:hypothetical protein